jgi:two-component system chemotaxis response regulator CheY
MKIYDRKNWDSFAELIPHIKKNIDEWRVINVLLLDKNVPAVTTSAVAARLNALMQRLDGGLFVYGAQEIISFAQLGKDVDLEQLKEEVAQELKGFQCRLKVKRATIDGLNGIEIVLSQNSALMELSAAMETGIRGKRAGRKERVIFVVDDDMFMRSLIAGAVKPYGRVVEIGNGNEVLTRYRDEAPDMVFLDIHLPGRPGMDVLRAILSQDSEAHVVMISADSVRENVVNTTLGGAKWFLSKPFTREKIIAALQKCPAFSVPRRSAANG